MRISVWISDVCSSDLVGAQIVGAEVVGQAAALGQLLDGAARAERQAVVVVQGGVAVRRRARLDFSDDAFVDAGEQRRQRQVGIGVGTGDAVLDAARVAAAGGHAQGHRAVLEAPAPLRRRSDEHTSELQLLMRISYDVLCLKTKINTKTKKCVTHTTNTKSFKQIRYK